MLISGAGDPNREIPYMQKGRPIMMSKLPFQFSSVDNRTSARNAPDQNLPDYMKVIVGDLPPTTQTDLATQNVLELNPAMMGIYDNALKKYQKTFLARHPVILALFTGQGGQAYTLPPGHGAPACAIGSGSLPGLQIGFARVYGSFRTRRFTPGNRFRPVVGGPDAYVSYGESIGFGPTGCGRSERRSARQRGSHTREQHRVHGCMPQ